MGFRNPITTAEDPTARAMATEALTQIIPGTRLAADAIDGKTITGATVQTAASGPRAVFSSLGGSEFLQLFAGHTGESPGGVGQVIWPVTGGYRADVYLTPSAVIPVGGGGGPVLPEIIISRDPSTANQITIDAATGGAVTLKGKVNVNGQPWAQQRAWNFPRSNYTANAADNFSAGTFVTLIDGTIPAAPAGDYLVTCTLVISAAAATTGYLRFVAGPTYFGDSRADRTTVPTPLSSTVGILNWTGGDLRCYAAFDSATQLGTVQTAGSNIAVAYLGPRT